MSFHWCDIISAKTPTAQIYLPDKIKKAYIYIYPNVVLINNFSFLPRKKVKKRSWWVFVQIENGIKVVHRRICAFTIYKSEGSTYQFLVLWDFWNPLQLTKKFDMLFQLGGSISLFLSVQNWWHTAFIMNNFATGFISNLILKEYILYSKSYFLYVSIVSLKQHHCRVKDKL